MLIWEEKWKLRCGVVTKAFQKIKHFHDNPPELATTTTTTTKKSRNPPSSTKSQSLSKEQTKTLTQCYAYSSFLWNRHYSHHICTCWECHLVPWLNFFLLLNTKNNNRYQWFLFLSWNILSNFKLSTNYYCFSKDILLLFKVWLNEINTVIDK